MHSFIFYGPNGTGKTTSARLFARAINCKKFKQLQEICEECAFCQISKEENCVDIIEIDGATNNGVEFVREINKNALYPPLKLPKKLYLIDEAHCLSLQSWNALLKLIEEPPDHLIIILITTEIRKIIPTILSRCQKLNFPELDYSEILPLLSKIVKSEKHHINRKTLEEIAKSSKGSVRESLVLLEKLFLSNFNETITNSLTNNETASQIINSVFDNQIDQSLKILKTIKTNFSLIFESILNHLLELSFYVLGKKSEDFLKYFSKQQAEMLLDKKKDITAMINFLAANIYISPSINSFAYAKFLLLNLLQISYSKLNASEINNSPLIKEIETTSNTQTISVEDSYKTNNTPLKAVLSETISDKEDETELPNTENIFSNSLLHFQSFNLPQFEFQEILLKEEQIIQILQECQKLKGEQYYKELLQYLESDSSIPLISKLFKKIHPKYKFICSNENCLVIFSEQKDHQYFTLKLKNLQTQEIIHKIFSKPINFYSISLNELPNLLEKKKLLKIKKLNNNLLSTQDEKLFKKIKELFNTS